MEKEQMFENETITTKKNKTHVSRLIPTIIFLGIWAIALIHFWLFLDGSDAMGWSILYLYLLMPAATFVVSLLIGKNPDQEASKWFFPILFGVMYMLLPYLTFSLANSISFGHRNTPQYSMILWGGAISLIGLAIGSMIKSARKNKITG